MMLLVKTLLCLDDVVAQGLVRQLAPTSLADGIE
jgi:hypothetical protein